MQDSALRRREMHMRRIETRAFARQAPSDAVHDIRVRLTLDDERIIRDVGVEMGSMPLGSCHEIKESLRPLIGECVGRGWRQILRKIPRNATCVHVHEVLVPMATVVHQGMSMGRDPEKPAIVRDTSLADQPFFVDDCHSWRANGPVVAQFYPQFSRKRN